MRSALNSLNLEHVSRSHSALLLTDAEREHLFLIGLGRPAIRDRASDGVTPRLQRLLDTLECSRPWRGRRHGMSWPGTGRLPPRYSTMARFRRSAGTSCASSSAMVVYNPATLDDATRIRARLETLDAAAVPA
ncbi:MAG TPA: hypothetical protein VIP08_08220 [Phenylobacterium sp.]|uniref:Uncharacterized protein n=1 Tax=Phenylobacterium koreense TaxID=266125 RepID=A0ABV2ED81_9CAUL